MFVHADTLTCSRQHMCVPYVYKERVCMQLVNRLFNTQTHTQFQGTYKFKSLSNPSCAHQATLFHLTSSMWSHLSYIQIVPVILLQGCTVFCFFFFF